MRKLGFYDMSNISVSEFGLSEFEAELISEERRSEPRRVTLLQAEVILCEDAKPIECVVTDISNSGARVMFEDVPKLPDEIRLKIDHPKTEHRCEVCWTNGDEAGLRFIR